MLRLAIPYVNGFVGYVNVYSSTREWQRELPA
jgi:hypothetical protein